jgi:hypothetical protein
MRQQKRMILMTNDQEQQVLSTLYTTLFDAITFSPAPGQPGAFDKATTFLQFSKNEALNPADFANAVTPINPNGNMNAAETFAAMIDVVPAIQVDYAPSGDRVSEVYTTIVQGADTSATVDAGQLKIYDQAYGFLNTTTTVKDYAGNPVTTTGPSQIAQTYNANLTAYIAAVSAYRTAYLGYDLTDVTQQRQWQANAPMLQNVVTQTYNTWRNQGAAQVEQAQAAVASSINSAVQNAIAAAQEAVSATHQIPSSIATDPPWLLSYALPTNWADDSIAPNLSSLTIDSANLNKTADTSYTSYGGGASYGGGLWSVGGSFEHSEGATHSHMDAQNVKLSAKIGIVRIFRPWLHEFLFRMNGWYINGKDAGGISNGALAGNSDGLLPLIPTAFIVARDIEITGDFSTEDQSHMESSTSGSASVGWGPFSVSGHYSHSTSSDTFNSTFSGGTLKIPGMQIIAWVSEIVPKSAPQTAPAKVTASGVETPTPALAAV